MIDISWINFGIQLLIGVFVAGGIYASFKSTLNHHEKLLEKHDQAIDAILKRVEAMNSEFTFMKGWITGKNH